MEIFFDSFLILLSSSSSGVTLFFGSPSILCILYFLLDIWILCVSFFFNPLIIIKFSNFSSLPIAKTKSPPSLTKIFLLLKKTLFLELVFPNKRPPWVKLPLISKRSEKTLAKDFCVL